MSSYFVLWVTPNGLTAWSGPHDTFEEACSDTPMRDRKARAFVTVTDNAAAVNAAVSGAKYPPVSDHYPG